MTLPDDPHASFAQRLREEHGAGVDPEVSLDPAATGSGPSSELLRRLAADAPRGTRYVIEGELARGGMGAILSAWDPDLRRHLAMKVALGRDESSLRANSSQFDRQALVRFLEEAQVTGQLEHPGIVPVHELGLDAAGRVYFTMRLVQGRDLESIFRLARADREGWSETRALGVILRVCEALGFAHQKGVIHRDLKPANVMVGAFGEVYVMDWGLARVVGHKDAHDLRLKPDAPRAQTSVRTERRTEREGADDSPLVTMDGDVVGTPAYMPPEQARGQIDKLGPHSDVYSVGAMLYHLLAGHMPYVPPETKISNHTVLALVLNGPPTPLHEIRTDIPAELIAICEKAMSRAVGQRYPDTTALADDLRAFLEQRVVRAYETGAIAELRKWVARNRGLAAASAAAVLILIVGFIVASTLSVENRTLFTQAKDEAARADSKALELAAEKQVVEQERNRLLGLADLKRLADAERDADQLWPALPQQVATMDTWLAKSRELAAHLPRHREHLARVEAELAAIDASNRQPQDLAARAPGVTVSPTVVRTQGAGIELAWLREQLASLIQGLEVFTNPDPALGAIAQIEKRREFALTVVDRTISGAEASARWSEAHASARDAGQCPLYAGMSVAPQLGLLPIGPDPASGLLEFAHLQTGEPAERGPDGKLLLTESTGLVFVLIPGGTFVMGAQSTNPTGLNYDPQANVDESPVHSVTLAPFFLSKYEMTQGQWLGSTGRNPSQFGPGWETGKKACTLLSPVEQVSWDECAELMRRLDLALPTEAQWEYAARAGTTSAWWTGDEKESLAGAVNLADAWCMHVGGPKSWTYEEWLNDGWSVHAPVGTYRANPFGLHDVIGNVWEWCRESYGSYTLPVGAGDGERQGAPPLNRTARGGSNNDTAAGARTAIRTWGFADSRRNAGGLRPAKSLLVH